ncbi:YccF domain-containing protein [Streptacidiphilus fuscans]|uniref:YccF domain-containing protein n=1 Tax=Streptacidiphilus fuscans TaxID=2789292 RepID=A0A931FC04_9ACTN|nr:YccF domain-containing protein [Streptacidiphilus fuscans]MBF9067968.1 YccF domain-containing protein [Streptacidiphilus fuscans]
MKVINFVLNVLWLVLCGLWMSLAYVVAGIICAILIITIPWAIASFRIALYVLWPFGRTTRERPDAGAASCAGNVVWLIFAGWWLAIGHLATSIALAVTIIGLPFAWANLKMIPISLMPLGREIVSTDERFAGWGA